MVVINYTRSNIIYHVLAKQPLDANPRSEKESMKRCPQRRLDMLSDELNKQLFVIPDSPPFPGDHSRELAYRARRPIGRSTCRSIGRSKSSREP